VLRDVVLSLSNLKYYIVQKGLDIMKGKSGKGGIKGKFFDSSLVYILIGVILAFGINHGLALALSTDIPIVAVESGSMEPTFYRGDILVLHGAPAEDLDVGDIIVFSPASDSTPVVHRIVDVNSDGTFQTKGDANSGQLPFEKSIDYGQVHGEVVLIIPYLGWVKLAMTDYILPNILWLITGGLLIGVVFFGGERIRKSL
jgi:signal peptidase